MSETESDTEHADIAAAFAVEQARSALCYLLQTPILSKPEKQIAYLAFKALGDVQERVDG